MASEENKATPTTAAAATNTTDGIEDDVKDLEITANGTAAAAKDPNSKLGSNYYFFKSTPKEEQHKYAPQPIVAAPPAATPDLARQGSAWNTAGTWEDRDMSTWAHDRVKSLFADFELTLAVADCKARITTVSKVEGDASIVYTRGKRKIGYELSFTADFSGEHKSSAVSGTIECPSIDFGDNDFDVIIKTSKSDAAHDAVRAALSRNKALIHSRFEVLTKELNAA